MNCKLNRKLHRKFSFAPLAIAALSIAAATPLVAQSGKPLPAPLAATAPTAVPALVPYSGTAIADGKPLTGEAGVTFLVYADQTGGEPLFAETQEVTLDAGHYQVQLGASLSSGLPIGLFASGEARWLEAQIAGQPPQPRVLLASVPYALKSADAATLGGLPASAFVLAGSKEAAALATQAVGVAATTTTASNVTTTGGTSGYLPVFTGANSVGDSILFSSATGIGVGDVPNSTAVFDVNGKSIWRGLLNISRAGNATAAGGFDSYPLFFQASAFNSATKTGAMPAFQLQAEPTGNNTATPGATFNLLYNNNGGAPTETGLSINPNGTIHFAAGQTFPGGTGAGTITGVTAGPGLTGGGTTGNVTLNLDTSKLPLLDAALNVFSGSLVASAETIEGSLGVNGAIGAAIVYADSLQITQPSGSVASPELTIQADDNGVSRSTATQLVIQGATTPAQQLLMGYVSDFGIGGGGYATIQATWSNFYNTPLLLQPNGGSVCIAPINKCPYSNPLIIGQGEGGAVADAWYTYSSRRFKTNIQTLTGALDRVEKLRGVSYTLKATGKREIGVIAEEVGAVVPEVVTYEPNGKDAQSVDYTRLTALLIEATKQQQAEIEKQGVQLTAAMRQIHTQQVWRQKQDAGMKTLKAQLHIANRKQQGDEKQALTETAMLPAK